MIVLLIIFTLFTTRFTKENENYLSKQDTNIIKGFFLFFVFVGHSLAYVSYNDYHLDILGLKINGRLEQLVVVMFLFYSGFGIMEQLKQRSNIYIKEMPKRRIFTTWFRFAVAVTIFMIVSQFMRSNNFTIIKYIRALFGLSHFGNSNWYIYCILNLYIIAYLSLKTFKNKNARIISMFIGTVIYCLYTKYIFRAPRMWYGTSFCFVFGVSFSTYKEKIEEFFKNKEFITFILILISFLILYKLRKINFILYVLQTIFFAMLVLLVTRKIKIKNFPLEWMGRNLFPLYIYQRLPMMVLCNYRILVDYPHLFFIICFALTVLITFLYNFIIRKTKSFCTKYSKT